MLATDTRSRALMRITNGAHSDCFCSKRRTDWRVPAYCRREARNGKKWSARLINARFISKQSVRSPWADRRLKPFRAGNSLRQSTFQTTHAQVAHGERHSICAPPYRFQAATGSEPGASRGGWLRFGSKRTEARIGHRDAVIDTQQGVFWALLLGVFLFSRWVIERLVARGASVPTQEQLGEFVLPERLSLCVPEPAEQLTFVLALIVPVCAVVLCTLVLRWSGCFKHQIGKNSWWLGVLALAAQAGTFFIGSQGLSYELRRGHHYRFFDPSLLVWLGLVVGVLLAWPLVPAKLRGTLSKASSWFRERGWLAFVAMCLFIVAFALTGVYSDGEFRHTPGSIQFHLPYTLAEFAATVNGSTPLVDFFSQYQNLTAWLLTPLFRAVGLSLGSFSLVMTALNGLGFLLLFSALARVCRSQWTALLLMVLVLAFGSYSEEWDARGNRLNAFNYYAMGPLRYLGFCLLARVAVWYLESARVRRLVVAAVLSAIVAWNNLDFGIPAAGGIFAAALLFPPRRGTRPFGWDVLRAASLYLTTAIATLACLACIVRVASGSWPQVTVIADFQKAFAMLGYFMIPLPPKGLYWVLYLTLMAAVLVPVYDRLATPFDGLSRDERLVSGSLLYTGIASAGALAYYVGRSHPYTLEATFLAWGYIIVQLAHRAYRRWLHLHSARPQRALSLAAVPTLMSVGLTALMLPTVLEMPDPLMQYQRLTTTWTDDGIVDAGALALLKKHTREGETALIDYPNAHLLAISAGIRNVFPFAHPGSLIIKAQDDLVVTALEGLSRDSAAHFFGSPNSDLRNRLVAHGFREIDGAGDFAVWQRD